MIDWQPIDTAPKDGSPLLLFTGSGWTGSYWTGSWDAGEWREDIEGRQIAPRFWARLTPPDVV